MTTAHLALVASDALATCRPIPGAREVTSLADLDRLLRATCSSTSTSLDLYGHATRGHNHLRIGRDVLVGHEALEGAVELVGADVDHADAIVRIEHGDGVVRWIPQRDLRAEQRCDPDYRRGQPAGGPC